MKKYNVPEIVFEVYINDIITNSSLVVWTNGQGDGLQDILEW